MPTNELAQASWVGIVQQLCDHLQENEDKIQFLRQIDKSMVDISMTLEDFVSNNISDLVRFSRATRGNFYVDSGDDLLLLHTTSSRGIARSSLSYDDLSSIMPADQQKLKVIEQSNFGQLKQIFPHSSSLLLVPIRFSEDQPHTLTSDRFGLIILETQHPEAASHFRNQAIQSFAHTVAGQLALGLQFRLKSMENVWFRELINSFFRLDLGPYKCFKELAEQIPDYLPSFGPFQIENQLEAQILTYNAKGNYLTIVGTTGEEAVGTTKVKVEESITGLIFENPDMLYFLGDPRNDRELKRRYKAYLGKAKTELVVPIEDNDGKRIAAINLESELEDAFTKIHVEAMLELCDILAPMIIALRSRLVERERQQEAIIDAQRSYWNTVGAILRHNTNGLLASIRLGIDNAKEAVILDKPEKIEKILTPIQGNLISVAQEIEKFSKEIYSTVYDGYSIRDLIAEAIATIRERLDKEKWVQIDFSQSEDFEVFCSPILKMHIYNIIDNSIYWVERRIATEPDHQGKVSITVKPGPQQAEDQEQELNQTCEVTIEDNGLGCPPEILDKLLVRSVESRRTGEQGMGYALYAAANYIYTVGGTLEVDSEEGKWFKTTMYLPIFDARLHAVKSFTEN